MNHELSPNELQPFAHADQAETALAPHRLGIKPCAGVGNNKVDPSIKNGQVYLRFQRIRMFHNVPQGLLENSKEADSNIFRNLMGDVAVKKGNLQFALVGEFSAETCDCRNQALKIEFSRMELVRNAVKICRDLGCHSNKAVQTFALIGG